MIVFEFRHSVFRANVYKKTGKTMLVILKPFRLFTISFKHCTVKVGPTFRFVDRLLYSYIQFTNSLIRCTFRLFTSGLYVVSSAYLPSR